MGGCIYPTRKTHSAAFSASNTSKKTQRREKRWREWDACSHDVCVVRDTRLALSDGQDWSPQNFWAGSWSYGPRLAFRPAAIFLEKRRENTRRSRVTRPCPADLEPPEGWGLALGSGWSGPTSKVGVNHKRPAHTYYYFEVIVFCWPVLQPNVMRIQSKTASTLLSISCIWCGPLPNFKISNKSIIKQINNSCTIYPFVSRSTYLLVWPNAQSRYATCRCIHIIPTCTLYAVRMYAHAVLDMLLSSH